MVLLGSYGCFNYSMEEQWTPKGKTYKEITEHTGVKNRNVLAFIRRGFTEEQAKELRKIQQRYLNQTPEGQQLRVERFIRRVYPHAEVQIQTNDNIHFTATWTLPQ